MSARGWGTHTLGPLPFRAGTYSGVLTLLPPLSGEGRAHHGEILARAAEPVEAGKLAPRIDSRRFGLADAAAAHEAVARGVAGKVVVGVI